MIHLIAPKWKRFLASHLLCLKKEKEKSSRIPHVYQPTSHSAIWALIPPPFAVVPSVISWLILRKLPFTGRRKPPQRGQNFSSFCSFAGARRVTGDPATGFPPKSLSSMVANSRLCPEYYFFLLFLLSNHELWNQKERFKCNCGGSGVATAAIMSER